MIESVEIKTKKGALTLREICEDELPLILDLQSEAAEGVPESIYVRVTSDELSEGFRKDIVTGIYDGERLVAFSLVITNRRGGLFEYLTDVCDYRRLFTFDAVVVDREYRGLSLQRTLIEEAVRRAVEGGAEMIAATVSPDNPYSLANFEKTGFVILKKIKAYGGLDRMLMINKLN